jgi:hypothetical protein
MLELSNPGDAHTARHDEVRSVSGYQDCSGYNMEKSEFSLDPFGEDNRGDDTKSHDGEYHP